MKSQATRCTQKEQSRMPPEKTWHWAEFAVSGVLILACAAWMWWRQ